MQEAGLRNHEVDDRGSRSLSIAALIFVALAAVMGWGASFVGLHEYGMQSMAGFDYWSAWLLPATFDGAAFACTLMTYRSSINGRSAFRGRVLMWAFTAVSSWINWIHQPSPEAQIVAAGLPIAAVAVFDVVLIELRADYEARHGKRGFRLRPGLLVLRWMVDRRGTREAFRKQVMDIPVEEIAGLGPMSVVPRQQDKVPAGAERGAAQLDAVDGSDQFNGSSASSPAPGSSTALETPRNDLRGRPTAPPEPPITEAETALKPTGVGDSDESTGGEARANTTQAPETSQDSETTLLPETVPSPEAPRATGGNLRPEETRDSEAEAGGTPAAEEEQHPGETPDAANTADLPDDRAASASAGRRESEASETPQEPETTEKPRTAEEPGEAPSRGEERTGSEDLSETEQQTIRISLPAELRTAPESEHNESSEAQQESASAEAETAAQGESSGDGAQTMALPPVPEGPMSDKDKRTAARNDYRTSLELDQPVSGAQLGKRYGLSESWGRRQINAAREQMRRERHPVLVGSESN